MFAAVLVVRANGVVFEGETAPKDLRWRRASIQIALSSSLRTNLANIKAESDVAGAVRRSLDTWKNAANLDFQISNTDRQNVSPSAAGDGVSLITIAATPENLLLFSKNSERLSATTRVFFNKRGAITEADIVLNPYQQFSTDGTFGTFDLESVLTHELGHLVGLDHSPLIGATMHDSYGRNGLYGLQNFASRSLSASDIAAVRTLYGQPVDADDCCSSIVGSAEFTNGKPVKGATVWIEDESGRVGSIAETATDGRFRFDGIVNGSYKVYAGPSRASKIRFVTQLMGKVVLDGADENFTPEPIKLTTVGHEINFIGFNGQLSDLAVPVNAGRTYNIYLGGNKIDAASFVLASPFLSIIPNSLRTLDYGDDVTVVTFQIEVDPACPSGEYTVFARDIVSGSLAALPGGISVGESPNPFSISSLQKF
ncbi:MAG TPA: matrixin family metalloprotease [Pyrinomonadaceae bacterium]|nr:matrixin family metalloprotease [Pyrinomonadaceae bacterium]